MAKSILILAANPKNTSRLRLDEEIRGIDDGLQRAQKRDEFVLEEKWAVRPEDVRRAVLNVKPSIVHFCGHGTGEEGIMLEDETGNAKVVDAEALSGFFELFADHVECVILNACYSEIQAEAIARHINYVIGMKRGIGDITAITFAVAFYDALGSGESIEFAYKIACNAIQWMGKAENLTPVLKFKQHLNVQIPRLFTINHLNECPLESIPILMSKHDDKTLDLSTAGRMLDHKLRFQEKLEDDYYTNCL